MDFNTTLELIIKDLNEAVQIIDNFKSYPDVPELHIEIAKAKCKISADLIALLKKTETTAITVPPEDEKNIEKDILTIETDNQPEPEEKQEECVSEIEIIPSAEEVVKTQAKPSSIIADNFNALSERLNEHQHINSMHSAIGLNDRFLLIREIFNGDKDKYEQTITALEAATSMDDAREIISACANPDDENEAMDLLIDLVKRKLNPNE